MTYINSRYTWEGRTKTQRNRGGEIEGVSGRGREGGRREIDREEGRERGLGRKGEEEAEREGQRY